MIRRPAVAGTFYPADPRALEAEIAGFVAGRRPPRAPAAIAVMVPHAGYIYSGGIAVETYLATHLPGRVVILGPNHTGLGEPIAVMAEGDWRTPFGDVPIDAPLAAAILERCGGASIDAVAHQREHSLEVQIPLLQQLAPSFSFVPICVGTHRLGRLLDLGRAIAQAVAAIAAPTLLVLSSDMSHYLPATEADRLDRRALAPLLALDPAGLHREVTAADISMCGMAPVVAGLEAAVALGASEARLVAYGHSGERTGDHDSVVAYAGVAVL
ncbi:MAG TPA: AmmeMemoRadiSam system protein B [Dongiaceae bacterium]|nr:AmmeMemoRadiSam system protein B [Dongiaceae bacterium]